MDESALARKRTRAWQMYDWADSAFVTIVVTALLPLYFKHVSTAGLPNKSASFATALWSLNASISMALVAVAALVLGPVADAVSRKKRYLAGFVILGAGSTALLAVCPGQWWLAVAALFILGNLSFNGGNVFYDSLLPSVAKPNEMDRVSSGGYAIGYIGGGGLLALCILLIKFLPQQTVQATGSLFPVMAMRLSFLAVAAWWAIFSLPLFLHVPEPPSEARVALRDLVGTALARLRETTRSLPQYRNLLFFLVAFWLYSDGFGTIIKVAVIFGDEIFRTLGKNPQNHLIAAVLLVQFVGIPCTLFWGWMAGKIGVKPAVLATLAIYCAICVFGYFMKTVAHFYILGIGVGFVQGGAQALSRSLFARLVPHGREAEFFGFYNISGKFAGIFGPALFAAIGYFLGTSRPAILGLIAFFAVGAGLLAFVKVPEQGE